MMEVNEHSETGRLAVRANFIEFSGVCSDFAANVQESFKQGVLFSEEFLSYRAEAERLIAKHNRRVYDLTAEMLRHSYVLADTPTYYDLNFQFDPEQYKNDIHSWLSNVTGIGMVAAEESKLIHISKDYNIEFDESDFLGRLYENLAVVNLFTEDSFLVEVEAQAGKATIDIDTAKKFFRMRGVSTFIRMYIAVFQEIRNLDKNIEEKKELMLRQTDSDKLLGQLMRTGSEVTNWIVEKHTSNSSYEFLKTAPIISDSDAYNMTVDVSRLGDFPKIIHDDDPHMIKESGRMPCPASRPLNIAGVEGLSEADMILLGLMRKIVNATPDWYFE